MGTKQKILIALGATVVAIGLLAFLMKGSTIAVLQPRGEVAERQLELLIFTTALSLVVVIPVFILTIYIVAKYRADNPKKASYKPDWDHSKKFEAIWWGIPILLIGILSVVTWRTSHSLDPYKPLASNRKPLTVQVVALQWKWLFIYPEQNIASLNVAPIPVDTPILFKITADAPMNAFWVPQLGSQIYAMSGMSSQLNLQANQIGDFRGVSSNLSGSGFADMSFTVKATAESDFRAWVRDTQKVNNRLSYATYQALAQPSVESKPNSYSSVDYGLYDTIVMNYMAHGGGGMEHGESQ